MSLLDDARLAARVTDPAFDPELVAHVVAALTDMRRVGVREELLDPDELSPLAKEAVLLYVRANFGYDVSESERFMASYQQTVADMLNSSANECGDDGRGAALLAYAEAAYDALTGGDG